MAAASDFSKRAVSFCSKEAKESSSASFVTNSDETGPSVGNANYTEEDFRPDGAKGGEFGFIPNKCTGEILIQVKGYPKMAVMYQGST